jgi:hypothetical protein
VTAVGLAAPLLGCHHTCGICDCDHNNDPCLYYAPSNHAALPQPIPVSGQPQPIPLSGQPAVLPQPKDQGGTVMPKATDK